MCWRIAPMCDCHAVASTLLVPELHSGTHLYRAVVLRTPSIRYIFPMRERYRVTEPGNYFLTMTIVEWIPVFIGVEACNIIVDSLKYCRAHKGLLIRAFVIMENHIHLIAEAPDLPRVVQDFKRHTAGEIIRHAEATGKAWQLSQFAFHRKPHLSSARQVWQEGYHPQRLLSPEMRAQKTAYIHNNPVRRGYVDLPEHWRYSSARNYLGDTHTVLEVDIEDE